MNSKENNTYYVTIIETLKKRVEVEASDEDEAVYKVEHAYNKCDIILDENDFTGVKFKVKKIVAGDTEEDDEE